MATVSMKLTVDVSQITGTSNIGGINQPVIGQKKTEIDVRLKEGEVSMLARLDRAHGHQEHQWHTGARRNAADAVFVLG